MNDHTAAYAANEVTEPNEVQAIRFRDEDIALKNDVNLLGKILGDTLIKIEGLSLFHRVERVRQAALDRRSGNGETADRRLVTMLSELEPHTGSTLARAFSAYFGLVNMAERIHSMRRQRERLISGDTLVESYQAVLHTLKQSGIGVDALTAILRDLQFTPVFTAHPTESVRRTLMTKDVRMAEALISCIDPSRVAPFELEEALDKVRHEVGIAWQTDELSDQPTVTDEVHHVLFFLSEIIYHAIPQVYQHLSKAITDVYGKDPLIGEEHKIIRFASWVGGDMDGNPNVNAETIGKTLKRQRETIVRCYLDDLNRLFEHMSHSERLIDVSEPFRERLSDYRTRYDAVYGKVSKRYRDMPYRVLISFMRARLEALNEEDDETAGNSLAYRSSAEFLDDLRILGDSIQQHGSTGSQLSEQLMQRVETFAFHMATLDVRQDSAEHRAAVGQALNDDEFRNLTRTQRTERLDAVLKEPVVLNVEPVAGSELARCLDVLRMIKACREKYGPEAIGPYIISMAEGPDDALAVIYLARLAGLVDGETGEVPLDIAPLFETVTDLNRSTETLSSLLQNPLYRSHIRGRSDNQVVMLGYSDSSKESGIAASRWALYNAQRALVVAADVAPGNPVELTLFHGRGGTISRGGGHPRRGILAEPTGSMRGRLRVTEQGEIISQKYGLRESALRTIEMMTGALLERCALHEGDSKLPSHWQQAMTCLAEESRATFRSMVFDTADFIPYFRAATPIDVIERLKIGSRPPARRGKSNRVEDLRAIPWVFAWTQSRHLFTGWYGVGSGLQALVDRFGMDLIYEMNEGWRFFANFIADIEMVLAKTDMTIAQHYAELAGDIGKSIYPQLKQEFDRTRKLICEIQQVEQLLDREKALQLNIRLRNPYVDPISLLQVDFLRRWRETGCEDEALERALIITVKGIARGMQNTG